MQVIRNFIRILSIQTFVVILLSFAATYLCLKYNIVVALPTALIGIAIVFPIVFSINAAFRRREEALRYFASLKAHSMALFYAHRDWLPTESPEHANRAKGLIVKLMQAIRKCFSQEAEREQAFQAVYAIFSNFSRSMEQTAGGRRFRFRDIASQSVSKIHDD